MTPQPTVERSVELAQHRDAVLHFIYRVVGVHDLAEDLTQETLLRAEQNRASFRGQASIRTWLFAIAFNACRDHFRAKARNAPRSLDLSAAERVPANVNLEQGLRADGNGELHQRLPVPVAGATARGRRVARHGRARSPGDRPAARDIRGQRESRAAPRARSPARDARRTLRSQLRRLRPLRAPA